MCQPRMTTCLHAERLPSVRFIDLGKVFLCLRLKVQVSLQGLQGYHLANLCDFTTLVDGVLVVLQEVLILVSQFSKLDILMTGLVAENRLWDVIFAKSPGACGGVFFIRTPRHH